MWPPLIIFWWTIFNPTYISYICTVSFLHRHKTVFISLHCVYFCSFVLARSSVNLVVTQFVASRSNFWHFSVQTFFFSFFRKKKLLLNEIETHPTNFRFVAFSCKMKNNFFLLFNDFDEKIAFLGEIKKNDCC